MKSVNCTNCIHYCWHIKGFICKNTMSDKKALLKAGSFHAEKCKYYIESEGEQ